MPLEMRGIVNLVPLPYNRVSVHSVDFELTEAHIVQSLIGKESYFQTDYVVLHRSGACAVAHICKVAFTDLFGVITAVEVLALPQSSRWVEDPRVDPGRPSALAEKARAMGITETETLVVKGLYEHVNFIHRPRPQVIDVFDVVPPEPPRLIDMAQRVLAYKDFPAVVINPHIVTIPQLVRGLDERPLLFPCGVSQLKSVANAFYLDERPERRDWVLVGCERSLRIHRHFYGDDPQRIELCPQKLFIPDGPHALMRCCLVDEGFEMVGRAAIVPWGAEPPVVEDALQALLDQAQSDTL